MHTTSLGSHRIRLRGGLLALAALAALARPAPADTQQYVLTLGEARFDPLVSVPAAPPGLDAVRSSGPDLHLVQFTGPTRQAWLADLRTNGLAVVQYIHPFTYIVWGEAAQLAGLERTGNIRWTGPFLPAYRLLPAERGRTGVTAARALVVRIADPAAVARSIAALGATISEPRNLNDRFAIVGFEMDAARMAEVAALPGVYSVHSVPTSGGLRGEMSDQVNVNNLDESGYAFTGYADWLAEVGLSGAGVVIANVDGGIQNDHPALAARLDPCTGGTCGAGASSGHGTHTAGIMAGDGTGGALDSFGFLRGLGVAPGAHLVEQLYSPTYTYAGGMLQLMTDSYNNGASLSGNSWGPAGFPLGYDDDTMQVDIGVRDADPDAPGNQPFSFVLSIMNGGGGTSSQGTPDEGKNIFTIGSTKMQMSGGAQYQQINDVSSNSAHGPCLDGRKIPHLVAPGCDVDSTLSGSSYGLLCGTSMASPHVSGAVALFIEYYRSLPEYVQDPSPALIKAAFLPAAHDLAGYLDADGAVMGHPFDNKQGWGRMNLEAVVNPSVQVRYFDAPAVFDDTGTEWTQVLTAADPTQPLKIMLVWTDAHGHGLGGSTPAWNNDLDLVVDDGTNVYYGNNFGSEGWSVAGGTADDKNNTEGVFIGPSSDGVYTLRVVATNINSDGVPNYGDDTDQDFVIVAYNAEDSALRISLPDGRPQYLAPGLATPVTVQVADAGEAYVPGTAQLHYRYDGGEFVSQALEALGGELYLGTLPAASCGLAPQFYFSAQGDGGTTVYHPVGGPEAPFAAQVGVLVTVLDDSFESDLGWTVESVDLTDGAWERGTPVGDGSRGDPQADWDDSGQCFVTANRTGNSDVDGGPTWLTSPLLDLTPAGAVTLSYARWWSNDDFDGDPLDVEISADDGATWILLERVVDVEPAWVRRSWDLNPLVPITATMRVRFSVMDNPNNSVDEAAIDAVRIAGVWCEDQAVMPGDLNCDGAVNAFDVDPFVLALTDPAAYVTTYPDCDISGADINDDGEVNAFDIDPFVDLLVAP